MPRVTANDVKALITTNREVSTFIATAGLLVDETLLSASPALSAERLKQIELYLAAHFTAIAEERGSLIGEKVEQAEQSYSYTTFTAGLGSTRFGQQAMLLDSSGLLRKLAAQAATNKLPAQFRVA